MPCRKTAFFQRHVANGLFLLLGFISLNALTGCSTAQERTLPTPNTNVEKVWQHKMGQSNDAPVMRALTPLAPLSAQAMAERQSDYARDSWRETTNAFVRLPNPDIVMYVMPRKVGSLPIPGYTTVFPLYERVQYAMPADSPANLPQEKW